MILSLVLLRGSGPTGLGVAERLWLIANHTGATLREALRSWFGRTYYVRIMRRRSLKRMVIKNLGRTVEWLSARSWGMFVLGAARRTLDLARR